MLREITRNDASDILRLRSHERVMKYIDRPLAKTMDDALNLMEIIATALTENKGITWGISLKNTEGLIGTIGFWRIDKENHRSEIGYLLDPDYFGKGYMSEVFVPVIHYGFNTMKLHSIEANVNPDNKESITLLIRNNFVKEAHFKENYYYNGKFLDSVIYSRLNH